MEFQMLIIEYKKKDINEYVNLRLSRLKFD